MDEELLELLEFELDELFEFELLDLFELELEERFEDRLELELLELLDDELPANCWPSSPAPPCAMTRPGRVVSELEALKDAQAAPVTPKMAAVAPAARSASFLMTLILYPVTGVIWAAGT